MFEYDVNEMAKKIWNKKLMALKKEIDAKREKIKVLEEEIVNILLNVNHYHKFFNDGNPGMIKYYNKLERIKKIEKEINLTFKKMLDEKEMKKIIILK